MKKLFSIIMSVLMIACFMPAAAFADTNVAKIGDEAYTTLAAAIAAVHKKTGDERMQETTITLQDNATGGGFGVGYENISENGTTSGNNPVNIVIDLNGKTYTVGDPTVGSKGTETNGFQMLKGSRVTFKNGTIKVASNSKAVILFQNYCDLTLENVNVDITDNDATGYAVSNNFGSLTVKGNTTINANEKVAFDLWYGMDQYGEYDDGVEVKFGSDFTGTVDGKIEYGAANRAANMEWIEKTKLSIAGGTFNAIFVDSNSKDKKSADDFNITITGGTFSFDPSKYVADSSISEQNGDEKYVVRACTAADNTVVAKVGDKYYKTLAGALDDAEAGSTVTLLKDVEVKLSDKGKEYDDCDKSLWFDTENIKLDLNGKTLTTISNNGGSYNILNIFGTGWTVKNGSIIAKKADGTADSYAICVECENGTLTLNNVSLSGGVAAYDTVTVTLKNTTMGKTTVAATNYYCAYAEGGAKIIVENGGYTSNGEKPVFYAAGGEAGQNGYPASSIEINGGTFTGSIFGTNKEANGKGTISITGGLFNTKPDSTYCADGYAVVASGNSKYPFTVAENKAEVKTADTAATEVKSEGAKIEVTGGTGEAATEAETKEAGKAVSSAAKAVAGTTSEGLEIAAVTEAQKTVTEETASEAKETLKEALQNVDGASQIGNDTNVNIYVQPYLDITIAGAKVTTTTDGSEDGQTTTATVKELTLNIVPMVKTIASTADSAEKIVTKEDAEDAADKTQNAIEVGTAKEVEVTTPVTITIPLPSDFVTSTNDKLYIKHTKSNGTSYVYTTDITSKPKGATGGGAGESGSGGAGAGGSSSTTTYYATFTNPNGFSKFLITTKDASVAKIEGVGYTSLADALAAAEDGDTVTVLEDGLTASMSGSTRTIKLVNGMTGDVDAESINVTINGKEMTLAKNGEGGSFTYTKRSSGGGSSAAVTPPAGDEAGDTAKTDEEIAAENAAKAAELASALKLTARSQKTAKGNIKVTLTVDSDAIRQIEGLGYTIKYKFYRSTKKSASYKAKYEKAGLIYTNTAGTKGTRYYYKARVMVYDAQGALIAKTALTQCKYACRIR